MSRVGKMPVAIPSGVKAAIVDGKVNIEGPKGKLQFTPGKGVTAEIVGTELIVKCLEEGNKQASANYGTARAIINNMVVGVSTGWKRSLELNGVGYVAKVAGQKLTLTVGKSHDEVLEIPASIKANVEKNKLDVEGPDRELVGNFAARIRACQPPEPYLGKGIKYAEEIIRRKAGKAGKK
jgi:large subunit ribosomal protein L6